MQDYGCCLKLGDGEAVLRQQYLLLKVFLVLNNSNCREYQRALSTSVHLWEWMRSRNHPCWRLFKNNASAFNEESGEICFSVLAREIAGSGVRSDCEAVGSKFKLITTKMRVAQDLKFDPRGEDFAVRKHKEIKTDSAEVRATVHFFERTIRAIVTGAFRHYGADCGALDAQARRARSQRTTVPAGMVDKLKGSDVLTRLKEVSISQRVKFRGYWVHPHRDIWPASQPLPPEERPDPAGGDGQRDRSMSPKRQSSARRRKRPRLFEQKDSGLIGRVVAVPAGKQNKPDYTECWSVAQLVAG